MRIYFKGLSEIRAIAALAVVFHHIELFKHRENLPSLFNSFLSGFIGTLGKNGVYLFFVLSGFLITYLLLTELGQFGKINVKKFYLRRILRIWPLYYLLLVIGFFLLPQLVRTSTAFWGNNNYYDLITGIETDFTKKLLLFVFFFPNAALAFSYRVAGVTQSWSVGVEEQFYLLWPWIIGKFKNNILKVLVSVIVLKFCFLLIFWTAHKTFGNASFYLLYSFLSNFNIELMSLGGIGAYFLYEGKLNRFFSGINKIQVLLLIIAIAGIMLLSWNYFLLGICFLLFILANTFQHLNILHNKALSFLGDISYGIYMYHPVCMYASFCTSRYFYGTEHNTRFNLSFYILTVVSTILVSYFSYTFFEKRFLVIKKKLAVVQSGK